MGPRYDPAGGVAKFMTGTPSILGTAAVEEGAGLLLEAGIGPMRAKSTQLTSYLIDLADAWLAPLGCALATPREASRRGSHVTYRHPQAERIVGQLADASIITDYRTPDRCRFGLSPLTTRFTDVWTAVGAARDILEQNAAEQKTGEHNTGEHNTGEHNTGEHNTAEHNTAEHNTAEHNTAEQNTGADHG
jgi:kynureninase